MLAAIERLQPAPAEVLVVLPHGFSPPPERLGSERIIFSDKGMVRQRTAGATAAVSPLLLFLDDDLDFPSSLAMDLFAPLAAGRSQVSFPILLDLLPSPGLRSVVSALIGAASPMIGRSGFYIRVGAGGGWSYRRLSAQEHGEFLSEAAPGASFLTWRHAFEIIEFDDERWLERPGYALLDDQVMFYKFHCLGMTAVGVSGTGIVHLDAGSSDANRRASAKYAKAHNHVIFWHRFVYSTAAGPASRAWRAMCFLGGVVAGLAYEVVLGCARLTMADCRPHIHGLLDGMQYLSSNDYARLPPVRLSAEHRTPIAQP